MSNISPIVKVDKSTKPGIVEEIVLGEACSLEEVASYKSLFQEYKDIFTWSYSEIPGISPTIVEHHIDKWPDAYPIRQMQRQLHPSNA